MQTPPPRRVFVDTQGWAELYACASVTSCASGRFHATGSGKRLGAYRPLIWFYLNWYPCCIRATFGCYNSRSSRSLRRYARCLALPNVVVIHIDPALDQQAWGLLYTNPQQPWCLVIATSMALMRHEAIANILTADQHFAQAGFSVLL